MMVRAEGLRIELLESEAGTFFDGGSSTSSANGKQLLVALAHEIARWRTKSLPKGTAIPDPRGKRQLRQWGALARSRQLRSPLDAAERLERYRSCRCAVMQSCAGTSLQSGGPVEPANLPDCPIFIKGKRRRPLATASRPANCCSRKKSPARHSRVYPQCSCHPRCPQRLPASHAHSLR